MTDPCPVCGGNAERTDVSDGSILWLCPECAAMCAAIETRSAAAPAPVVPALAPGGSGPRAAGV